MSATATAAMHFDCDMTPLCLVVSVETGEKAEKEAQSKEEKTAENPKRSAKKKEKKLKGEGGFQIWTELETQRNKFLVTLFPPLHVTLMVA